MLPQKLYEALRWLLWTVLPAGSTLLVTLDGTWNWGLPTEAILTTVSAVATFIGAVLGINKIVNDKINNK